MNSNNKVEQIKDKFKSFSERRSEEQKIKHNEYMLMASFLSEIETVQKQKDIKRNKLAELVDISVSYLTQVFRGDKPLNFHTVAKIQKAFNTLSSDEVELNKYQERSVKSKYNILDYTKANTTEHSSSGKVSASYSTVSS